MMRVGHYHPSPVSSLTDDTGVDIQLSVFCLLHNSPTLPHLPIDFMEPQFLVEDADKSVLVPHIQPSPRWYEIQNNG
jgi:hypothetical protein